MAKVSQRHSVNRTSYYFPPGSNQGWGRFMDSLGPQNVLHSLFSGFSVAIQKQFPFGTVSFSKEHAYTSMPSSSHCWLPLFLWKEGVLINNLAISFYRQTFGGSQWDEYLTGSWLPVTPGGSQCESVLHHAFHWKPDRFGHSLLLTGACRHAGFLLLKLFYDKNAHKYRTHKYVLLKTVWHLASMMGWHMKYFTCVQTPLCSSALLDFP